MSEVTLIAGSKPNVLVYNYGCRIDADTRNLALDQFSRAHSLYNNLVAFVRSVADGAQAFTMERAPAATRALAAEVEALSEQFKKAKSRDDEPAMKAIAEQRRAAWKQLGEQLRAVRAAHKTELRERFYSRITKASGSEMHALLVAAINAGLGNDTAADVISSVLQAYQKSIPRGGRPHFRRAHEIRGETLLIAAHRGGGIPVAEISNGTYRPVAITLRGEQRRRVYHSFVFRAGAAVDQKFITGTVELHRPLPPDAGVAEIRLKRSLVGLSERWHLQFVCTLNHVGSHPGAGSSEREGKAKAPLAAVHLGWALRDHRRIVAAVASGTAEDSVSYIELPSSVERALDQVEFRHSERDALFNDREAAIRASLERIAASTVLADEAREDLRELIVRTAGLPSRQISFTRLHQIRRRSAACGASDPAFDNWADADRKLWEAAAFGARRASNQRRWAYRQVASILARGFECVALYDLDLAESAKKVDTVTGEKADLAASARSGRVRAAISELASAIKQAVTREGGVVLGVTTAVTTQCADCHAEGSMHALPQDSQIVACKACGAKQHRKANAARNIYRQVTGERIAAARDEAIADEIAAAERKVERLKKMQKAARLKRAA